jgi:hypothetical protein
MKSYIVLCKEKDSKVITMFSNLTFTQANRHMAKLRKEGASNLQLRKLTHGMSSVLL